MKDSILFVTNKAMCFHFLRILFQGDGHLSSDFQLSSSFSTVQRRKNTWRRWPTTVTPEHYQWLQKGNLCGVVVNMNWQVSMYAIANQHVRHVLYNIHLIYVQNAEAVKGKRLKNCGILNSDLPCPIIISYFGNSLWCRLFVAIHLLPITLI